MVYLFQEVYKENFGYDFGLYTYGPFSSQLLQDLDLVEHVGGVKIYPMVSGTGGYSIVPGERGEILREKARDFLTKPTVAGKIENLVQEFGGFWAKELELRSTIVYVERVMKRERVFLTREELAKVVRGIKPKFSKEEISQAISELERKAFIEIGKRRMKHGRTNLCCGYPHPPTLNGRIRVYGHFNSLPCGINLKKKATRFRKLIGLKKILITAWPKF
jgi:hypothetical protein